MSRLAALRRLDTSNTGVLSRDLGRLVSTLEEEFRARPVSGTTSTPVFYPASYGTVGRGDDTQAIARAVATAGKAYQETGKQQTVQLETGRRYRLKPSLGQSWTMPLLGSTAQVHVAVPLWSGVTIDFNGAEVVAAPANGSDSAWHYALFSTGLNMTVGDVESVKFLRPRFDFTSQSWGTYTNIYGVIATGVRGFVMEAPEFVSTTTAQGRGAKLLNCEGVRIADLRAKDVTQVLFLAYVDGLHITGEVDNFVEAFDFDAPCYRVFCDVTCRNGRSEAQCLDIASVQDAHFRLRCSSVGNAAIIYVKPDGHATFADWVANLPTSTDATSPVPSKRISIEIEGTDVHHSDLRAFQIALDRTDSGYGTYWENKGVMVSDVRARIHLDDTDPLLVYECDGLDLEATLRTVTTGTTDNVNNGAVILRQATSTAQALADSKLTGRARVKVTGSTRTGVRLSSPTDFYLEADVDGYNTAGDATSGVASGVWVSNLGRKNSVMTLGPCRVRNGDTTVDPADLRLTWDGATGTTYVRDLGGHRLETSGATQRVRTGGSGSWIQGGAQHLISAVSTTAGTVDVTIPFVCQQGARLAHVSITNLAAVAAGGANFTQLSARRIRAGVVSGTIGAVLNYDSGARAAGTVVDLAIDGVDADGLFTAGDIFAIRASQSGTGSSLANLLVRFTFVEFST